MKNILATSPKLDDIIRKAANRLGENHGLTRDSYGAVIDNQGNSTRYVGSGGQHPSHVNKPKSNKTFGWHRTLNEGEGHPGQTCAQAHSDMDHEDWLDENPEMVMDLEEDCLDEDCGDEIEEVTGASSAGGYEGPLFGTMTEQEERKKISKEDYNTIRRNLGKWLYNNLEGDTVNLWTTTIEGEETADGPGTVAGDEVSSLGSWVVSYAAPYSELDEEAGEDYGSIIIGFKFRANPEDESQIDVMKKFIEDYGEHNGDLSVIWECGDKDFMTDPAATSSQTGRMSGEFTSVSLITWLNSELCDSREWKDYNNLFSENGNAIVTDMGVDFSMGDEEMDMDMDVELTEQRILKSIIREEVSKKVSKQQLKESLKNRITRNILMEQLTKKDIEASIWDNTPFYPDNLMDSDGNLWCSKYSGKIPPSVMVELEEVLESMGGGIGQGGPSMSSLLKRIDPITFNDIQSVMFGDEEIPYIEVDSEEECEAIVKIEMDSEAGMIQEKAFYNDGKFKYEKPTKLPGEIKSMPGMKQTDSTLKKSKSTNNEYLKHFDKKIKDYLDFENNSHPEFPHQNNSKTDYKSPMYRNTSEDEEFIEDFRGMGLEDANGVDMLDRIDDYLSGSQKTGNAQTGKDGKALGNVVPNKVGDRIKKKVKRKKEKIAKQKSKMTNLRSYTPDVQTTTTVKESYLLTERPKWWKWLCCIPIALPFTWGCCVDQIRGKIASPSDLPPFNSPLSNKEMEMLKPHIQTNSLESLPRDIQELFKKIQPSAMAYAEELKNIRPVGPNEIKPLTKVDGIVREEVNKMKHLFNYKDTTQ